MANVIYELQQINIYRSLNANPPSNLNENYEIFVNARDKYRSTKNVKYLKNKHRLNKWMIN